MYSTEVQNLHNRLIISKSREMGIICEPLLPGCEDFLKLTSKGRDIIINKTRSHRLSLIAGLLAKNKEASNVLLNQQGLTVPPYLVVQAMGEKAIRFLESRPSRSPSVVVKPLDASRSDGVTLDVRTRDELAEAIGRARQHSMNIMIQQFLPGTDYRVLVINGRVAAVNEYRPAYVLGDGVSTVRDLINRLNQTRIRRSDVGEVELFTQIQADTGRLSLVLDKQGWSFECVPPKGTEIELYDLHNVEAGGISEFYSDCTDKICQENSVMAITAAAALQIDVAGIDLRCNDIGIPITATSGGILEVNALPDLTHHVFPCQGTARDVVRIYLEYLLAE